MWPQRLSASLPTQVETWRPSFPAGSLMKLPTTAVEGGEFPRPCMSVRQQGNLTGLSFHLCKMTGVRWLCSHWFYDFWSPSQALDSTPKEIFHFYLFLSPRLKSVNLIGNHQKKIDEKKKQLISWNERYGLQHKWCNHTIWAHGCFMAWKSLSGGDTHKHAPCE